VFLDSVKGTESEAQFPVPVAGAVGNLRVLLDTPPGVGRSFVFTIRRNGAGNPVVGDTTVTCVIAGAERSCVHNLTTASFAAGDLISVEVTPVNSPATGKMRWTATYTTS
jgi:hypothetical protein